MTQNVSSSFLMKKSFFKRKSSVAERALDSKLVSRNARGYRSARSGTVTSWQPDIVTSTYPKVGIGNQRSTALCVWLLPPSNIMLNHPLKMTPSECLNGWNQKLDPLSVEMTYELGRGTSCASRYRRSQKFEI